MRKYSSFDFQSLVQIVGAQLSVSDSQLLEQTLGWLVVGANERNGGGKEPCKSFTLQMRPEVHAVLNEIKHFHSIKWKNRVCNFYNSLIYLRSRLSLLFILILQLAYFTGSQVIWEVFVSLRMSWGTSHWGEMMMACPPGNPYLNHHLRCVNNHILLSE